jgi:metal-dependent amidase/aminoacylase/carboxypeptidase family protein
MAGEDFAWFLAERPGAYVWVGSGPIENGVGRGSGWGDGSPHITNVTCLSRRDMIA